jgi:hypothetical protein
MAEAAALPPSFYERTADDVFTATAATRGPWGVTLQHGGPVAALLARAIEASTDMAAFRVARFSVAFNKPLAIAPYRVAHETMRDGRKVKTMRAHLLAVGAEARPVATAEALLIRREAVTAEGPAMSPRPLDMPLPEACEEFVFSFFENAVGYPHAMETRRMHGTWGSGRMGVWMRMAVPLLPGETPSPLQRVMCAADSGGGVSAGVDPSKNTFINPEITVALAREPAGDWIGLDAAMSFADDGIGLADTRLLDTRGPIGRGVQPLLLDRR